MLKKIRFGFCHTRNLQYAWGDYLYFGEEDRMKLSVAFGPASLIFSTPPALPGRRLLSSLRSGLPQLCLMTLHHGTYIWCGHLDFSSSEPLNSSRFLLISYSTYSTSSVFQKLYLYLLPRLMSLPLFCILLWNFILLIIPSLNYIFCVFLLLTSSSQSIHILRCPLPPKETP